MDRQIKNQLQAAQSNAQNYGAAPDAQTNPIPEMTVAAPIPRPTPPSADNLKGPGMKKGGCVKMAKGGSASSRADGCAQRGKTRGRIR